MKHWRTAMSVCLAALGFAVAAPNAGATPATCRITAQPWQGTYNLRVEHRDGSEETLLDGDQTDKVTMAPQSWDFPVGEVTYVLWAQTEYPARSHSSWGDALKVDPSSCHWAPGVTYEAVVINGERMHDSVVIGDAPVPPTTTTTTVPTTTTTVVTVPPSTLPPTTTVVVEVPTTEAPVPVTWVDEIPPATVPVPPMTFPPAPPPTIPGDVGPPLVEAPPAPTTPSTAPVPLGLDLTNDENLPFTGAGTMVLVSVALGAIASGWLLVRRFGSALRS